MFSALGLAVLLHPILRQDGGLKIEDVKPGQGDVVIRPFDLVEVNYVGTLLDGKEFDSSVKHNHPFRFLVGVGSVIKGWDQGVLGMKVGGERNLTIPPDLAYGKNGAGDAIPGNATIKFNVKVVRIIPAAKIEIEKAGTGDPIKVGDFLDCKISIKLPDGKELSDPTQLSRVQMAPGVLPALVQAISGIKVGEKRKVVAGYELAFGEKGYPAQDNGDKKAGSIIPPKADLTFEIEAVKISS